MLVHDYSGFGIKSPWIQISLLIAAIDEKARAQISTFCIPGSLLRRMIPYAIAFSMNTRESAELTSSVRNTR
jgi:hypothetical protein